MASRNICSFVILVLGSLFRETVGDCTQKQNNKIADDTPTQRSDLRILSPEPNVDVADFPYILIKMIFAWDERNREHLATHAVSPEEAQQVVEGAQEPYPMEIGDQKLVVWGQTANGRYLQVIFVLKNPEEVDYESLAVEEWLDVEDGGVREIVRVIHAMDLTPAMKRMLRRRRK